MEENKPLENVTPEPVVLPETPEITPENPVVEQKKKPWVKIVILLIVILLGCGGLVFTGMEIQKRQTNEKVEPLPEQAATPTANQEMVFETYINTKDYYQIYYPKAWTVSEETALNGNDGNKMEYVVMRNEEHEEQLNIDANNGRNMSIKEIEKMQKSSTLIGNLNTYVSTGQDDGGNLYVVYYFIKNNNIYAISTMRGLEDNDTEKIFNQILSTFKFLE